MQGHLCFPCSRSWVPVSTIRTWVASLILTDLNTNHFATPAQAVSFVFLFQVPAYLKWSEVLVSFNCINEVCIVLVFKNKKQTSSSLARHLCRMTEWQSLHLWNKDNIYSVILEITQSISESNLLYNQEITQNKNFIHHWSYLHTKEILCVSMQVLSDKFLLTQPKKCDFFFFSKSTIK